jgi:hypothetical protein
VQFPNYDIGLFRNGSTLVTASSPESLGKLTVGNMDLPELPVKFTGSCSEDGLTMTILSPEEWNFQITILRFLGMDQRW